MTRDFFLRYSTGLLDQLKFIFNHNSSSLLSHLFGMMATLDTTLHMTQVPIISIHIATILILLLTVFNYFLFSRPLSSFWPDSFIKLLLQPLWF